MANIAAPRTLAGGLPTTRHKSLGGRRRLYWRNEMRSRRPNLGIRKARIIALHFRIQLGLRAGQHVLGF